MISMPLFFTSSALMPYDVMPAWLRTIAHVNPLSYAIDAVRAAETGIVPVLQIGLLAVFGGIVIAICMQMFRRVTV
jgi:ABC-2 type transport system permease protein